MRLAFLAVVLIVTSQLINARVRLKAGLNGESIRHVFYTIIIRIKEFMLQIPPSVGRIGFDDYCKCKLAVPVHLVHETFKSDFCGDLRLGTV